VRSGQGLLCLLVIAISTSSMAQVPPKERPATRVQSDQLQHDDQRQVTVFSGNVSLTRDGLVLRGDRLELTQKPDGSSFAVLQGRPARFSQQKAGSPTQIIGAASQLEYDSKTEVVVLVEGASLRRTESERLLDEVIGDRVVYNGISETYSVQTREGQGRAQMTLMPRASQPTGKGSK